MLVVIILMALAMTAVLVAFSLKNKSVEAPKEPPDTQPARSWIGLIRGNDLSESECVRLER